MTVEEILKQVSVYQNYSTVESLKKAGHVYELNYGVSVVTLKHLSNSIQGNQKLVQNLWKTSCREGMILATMIANPEKIKIKEVLKWSIDFTNPEIVEQICSNLLHKVPFWNDLVDLWLVSENELLVKAGLHILLKKAQNHKDTEAIDFSPRIPQIIQLANTDSLYVKKAVVLTLQALINLNDFFKEGVCEELNKNQSISFAWLKSELWWDQ